MHKIIINQRKNFLKTHWHPDKNDEKVKTK